MTTSDVLTRASELPIGSCIETEDATYIVGPKSIAITTEDPYDERYEIPLVKAG